MSRERLIWHVSRMAKISLLVRGKSPFSRTKGKE